MTMRCPRCLSDCTVTLTAYGQRATCAGCNIRWTRLCRRIEDNVWVNTEPWQAERHHPMTTAGTPKQATEPLAIAGIHVVTDERVPLDQVRIIATPRCRHQGGDDDCPMLCWTLYGDRYVQT